MSNHPDGLRHVAALQRDYLLLRPWARDEFWAWLKVQRETETPLLDAAERDEG